MVQWCVTVDGVDAAKRRHLPAWIREGLEKMEREKQRQLEKERQLQDAMNAKKLLDVAQRDAAKETSDEAVMTPTTAVKSRFVWISLTVYYYYAVFNAPCVGRLNDKIAGM